MNTSAVTGSCSRVRNAPGGASRQARDARVAEKHLVGFETAHAVAIGGERKLIEVRRDEQHFPDTRDTIAEEEPEVDDPGDT
jgi:hypothetical protein